MYAYVYVYEHVYVNIYIYIYIYIDIHVSVPLRQHKQALWELVIIKQSSRVPQISEPPPVRPCDAACNMHLCWVRSCYTEAPTT